MKKTLKKLSLKTESIKLLTDAALERAVGGGSGQLCPTLVCPSQPTGCICTVAYSCFCNTTTNYASCPFCGATAVGC